MYKYLDPSVYLGKLVESTYDIDESRRIELEKFLKYGFDYNDALQCLNRVLASLEEPNFESQQGMGSIHWVLFSAISLAHQVTSILEIGTFDGSTARLLSHLFPNAQITTLDLPVDDPIFASTYNRETEEQRVAFRALQKKNLASDNINYVEKNSFFLPEIASQQFDLIWIDGGHLYPEVAWDICNAYHLCKTGGWLMCDDVITNERGVTNNYCSPDSFAVLEYVAKRTPSEVTYFLKREAAKWSANPRRRKFVALMRKGIEK